MSKYKYAVMDIETTGLNRYKHKTTWIGIGLAESIDGPLSKKFLYDMRDDKDKDKFLEAYARLQRMQPRVIWQNGKFDVLWLLHHYGVNLPIHEDVMLLGTAYDLAASHKLEDMATAYLGVTPWKIPKKELINGEAKTVKPYLRKDLDYPWELFKFFQVNLGEDKRKHYNLILRPAYRAYRDIEINGIYLHKKRTKAAKAKYTQLRDERLAALKDKYDINWNSTAQLAKVLFEDEGLPVLKKSKKTGKPSADKAVLKRLAAQGHEIPKMVLAYREVNQLVNAFLYRWLDDAKSDGRIHPSFGLTNVRTGRTSCSDPNLQQVPRNKDLRSCFCADPRIVDGKRRVFFEADYSQLELRIAADYSNDPTMLRVYQEGGDIHTSTARIFTSSDPTKEDRTKAKPVNFGFVYGMQAKGFMDYAFDNYGVVFSLAEAKQARDSYFALYAGLLPWHEEMKRTCEALGGVYNRFGRFRKLHDIYSHEWGLRASAERKGINTPVQSTGSDLLICSAAQLNNEHKKNGLAICGTIHDAIVGECWEEDKDWVEEEIRRIMQHPKVMDDFDVSFKVPLLVDIGWGPWGSK